MHTNFNPDVIYSGNPQDIQEQEIKRLRELRKIKLHRLQNEPHRYFMPIGKFSEFADKAMSGNYKVSLLEAANGIGKTVGTINMFANLFWPVHNQYFQQPLMLDWPFPKQGRIISYANTITETIIPAMKQWFPKGRYNINKYETTKDGKRYEAHWETDTGWTFNLMTYDQDVREFESANLGFFWNDEPPSPAIFNANYSRLRMGGIGILTETPLKGAQWIYDEFVDKPDSELLKEKRSVTHAVLEDACEEHGDRGFLTHVQILDQIAGYNEDEVRQRVFGKHHHLTGLVFKKWDKRVHVIPPFNITNRDYVVAQALDPHPRTPDAVLWVAFDREGKAWKCNELWGEFETAELAERIKSIDKNYRIVKRLIDPSAYIIDKHTGYQLAADLSTNYHLDYEPGSKERQNAIEAIRRYIDFQMVGDEITVPPMLRSFDTCERANWEIGRWQWQDWRGISAQFKNPKEKPIDKDDHMIENLGRILLANIRFEEVVIERTVPSWAIKKKDSLDPYA